MLARHHTARHLVCISSGWVILRSVATPQPFRGELLEEFPERGHGAADDEQIRFNEDPDVGRRGHPWDVVCM